MLRLPTSDSNLKSGGWEKKDEFGWSPETNRLHTITYVNWHWRWPLNKPHPRVQSDDTLCRSEMVVAILNSIPFSKWNEIEWRAFYRENSWMDKREDSTGRIWKIYRQKMDIYKHNRKHYIYFYILFVMEYK